MEKYLTTSIRQAIRRAAFGAAVLGALAIAPAYASPLVQNWDFNGSANFNDATDTSDNAITPSNNQLGTANTALCWGDPAGAGTASPCGPTNGQGIPSGNAQSSLVINPSGNASPPPAALYTGNDIPPPASYINSLFTLTHNNEPIYPPSLSHADINISLNLSPNDGSGTTLPFAETFGIDFDETPNVAGTCPVDPLPGFGPCPDIFVLDQDTLNQSFSYDGNNYFVSFFALGPDGSPLGTLPNAACEAAGAPDGCFGFVTQETASNPFNMGFAITATPLGPPVNTPEPGELGLLGLGGLLLGLGVYRRRKETRQG